MIGVLASGAGSNLQALLADPEIQVVAVASDKPEAMALRHAQDAGVPTAVFPGADYPDRAARDQAMAEWLIENGTSLVVSAGYMQLLTPAFLGRFPNRVINVHPALLPAFPGLDAIGQALAREVKVMGVTVHYVDEGVDTGPIISQAAIDVPPGADHGLMRDLLRPLEHRLLCAAARELSR